MIILLIMMMMMMMITTIIIIIILYLISGQMGDVGWWGGFLLHDRYRTQAVVAGVVVAKEVFELNLLSDSGCLLVTDFWSVLL